MTARTELAEFLRARREQLKPEDVRLRDTGRRRTPGLRREEVATLAGVSIDYLVRLEQGRDVHPSPSVIKALAAALQLSANEQMHLARLAAIGGSPELCPSQIALVTQVPATVQFLIDQLDPTPAFVLGPTNDVLSSNAAWQVLVRPLGMIDDPTPNLVRYVFTHPSAAVVYPDWARAADEQVSRLRGAVLRWGEDDHFVALLAELAGLPEFAARWSSHSVTEKHRGTARLRHPVVGEMRLAYEVLQLPDDGEQRVVTWMPADEATAASLRLALADGQVVSPARLRMVREA